MEIPQHPLLFMTALVVAAGLSGTLPAPSSAAETVSSIADGRSQEAGSAVGTWDCTANGVQARVTMTDPEPEARQGTILYEQERATPWPHAVRPVSEAVEGFARALLGSLHDPRVCHRLSPEQLSSHPIEPDDIMTAILGDFVPSEWHEREAHGAGLRVVARILWDPVRGHEHGEIRFSERPAPVDRAVHRPSTELSY